MFYKDDFGLKITLTITAGGSPVDVSTFTVTMEFEDPDGAITVKSTLETTDGTDGSVYYVIESGLLAVVGSWSVRAIVTDGGTAMYRTSSVEFGVAP